MDENRPEEPTAPGQPEETPTEQPKQPEQPQQPVEKVVVETAKPKPSILYELSKKFARQPKQIGAPTGKIDRLKSFFIECKRVLRVTKKPDKEEFITIVKISSMGMAIIGVVGFLIHFAKELLFK